MSSQQDVQWDEQRDEQWDEQRDEHRDEQWDEQWDEQLGDLPLFTFDDDGYGINAGKKVLILNLLKISKADIKVSEFQRYAEEEYKVLLIRTPKYTYSITMEDLLKLFKDGEMSTFIVEDDQIEILLDDEEVFTLTVEDTLENAETSGDQIEIKP